MLNRPLQRAGLACRSMQVSDAQTVRQFFSVPYQVRAELA
jgi:hypothetical protein